MPSRVTDHDTDTRFAMAGSPPMSAHVPASSRVFEELRARIISLTLPPGARLSRADLAETFHVSQSPIREAMLRLEQVGLVVSYRQSKTEVTYIDRARLREENFFRTGIECEVINHLAGQGADADLDKARGILKMQTALADDPDQIALFRELDEDFHHQLFRVAGHEVLQDLVRERSSQMSRLRTLDLPSKGKMQSVIDGHAAILDAIQKGNRHDAVDAMRKHLSGTIDRLPEIVHQHPNYFSG